MIYDRRIRGWAELYDTAQFLPGSPASWISPDGIEEDMLKETLGHEIGHAVGLAHPWETDSD